MTDILIFIAGAVISAVFFILGAFFGAACHKAVYEIDTPDGKISFDLSNIKGEGTE